MVCILYLGIHVTVIAMAAENPLQNTGSGKENVNVFFLLLCNVYIYKQKVLKKLANLGSIWIVLRSFLDKVFPSEQSIKKLQKCTRKLPRMESFSKYIRYCTALHCTALHKRC